VDSDHLHPNQIVPLSLVARFPDTPPRAEEVYAAIAPRVLKGRVADSTTQGAMRLLLVLAGLRKRLRPVDRLAEALLLPLPECQRVVGSGMALGLIDSNLGLTSRGLDELRYAERKKPATFAAPVPDHSFYYPEQLQAARGEP